MTLNCAPDSGFGANPESEIFSVLDKLTIVESCPLIIIPSTTSLQLHELTSMHNRK